MTESIFRSNLLSGKVAIVTGGGTGIGKQISTELCSLGCDVVITARNFERLENAREAMLQSFGEKPHGEIVPIQCNIRKEEQVSAMVDQAIKRFGKIDFLVNNGGGQFAARAEDISLKGWEAVVQLNLTGTFLCCKKVFDAYMKDNGGSIVNIIAVINRGWPSSAHSGAARAGVENLTKTLAIEWASTGVRINSVAPGCIWNPTAVASYPDGPERFRYLSKQCPAKRSGSVEEVASAVTFLLSRGSSFTTGATLIVDGGATLYGSPFELPDHDKFPVYGSIPSKL